MVVLQRAFVVMHKSKRKDLTYLVNLDITIDKENL